MFYLKAYEPPSMDELLFWDNKSLLKSSDDGGMEEGGEI